MLPESIAAAPAMPPPPPPPPAAPFVLNPDAPTFAPSAATGKAAVSSTDLSEGAGTTSIAAVGLSALGSRGLEGDWTPFEIRIVMTVHGSDLVRQALSERSYMVDAYFYSVTPNHIVDHTAQHVQRLLRAAGLVDEAAGPIPVHFVGDAADGDTPFRASIEARKRGRVSS